MMDISHVGKCGTTPDSTQSILNDSGYITATPSTVCNDSPDNVSGTILSNHRPGGQYNETPVAYQKSIKVSSLRKHLLRQTSEKCELETVIEQVDNSILCSCAPDKEQRELGDEGNITLVKSFSDLIVDEIEYKQKVNFKVLHGSCKEDCEEFRYNLGATKPPSNTKKKSSNSLEKSVVKKLKQDYSSAVLCGRLGTVGNNSSPVFTYSGVSRLDIFVHLAGLSGSFPGIISQILSYLSPQDLVTMCLVSSEWRKVCVDDPTANRRRLAHVRHVKHVKENLTWDQFKQSSLSLNLSLATNKGVFREIQNTDRRDSNIPLLPSTPRSPPVSPSKVRFNIFVKAGVALDEGTRLICCPRCSHPSQAKSESAQCQAVGCRYKFCVFCLCDIHDGLPCPGRTVLPVRRKISCIGSKESRRNLRRL